MSKIRTPAENAHLLELLELLSQATEDVLTQLKQWDILLAKAHEK